MPAIRVIDARDVAWIVHLGSGGIDGEPQSFDFISTTSPFLGRSGAVSSDLDCSHRAQELRDQTSDESHGYKRMSLETFVLDAKALTANQSKLSVKGVYVPDGNVGWLLATQGDVRGR